MRASSHSTRAVVLTALVAAVLGLLVGAGTSWVVTSKSLLQGMRGMLLAHELETTGLCANALTLAASADAAKLSRLLETRLDSAVNESTVLLAEGARLATPAPNLRESARRAAVWYESRNLPERKHDADRLYAELAQAR